MPILRWQQLQALMLWFAFDTGYDLTGAHVPRAPEKVGSDVWCALL